MDLRPQKIERDAEEMLKHLKSSILKPRFSAGIWYFYPPGGRFHEPYIEKGTIEEILHKIMCLHDEDYIDSTFGLEAHFPNEVNRDNVDGYKDLEKETGIRLITVIPNLRPSSRSSGPASTGTRTHSHSISTACGEDSKKVSPKPSMTFRE